MKRILSSLMVLSVAWLTVGCTVQGPDQGQSFAERVAPTAQVTLGEEKAIDIAMGFVNKSNRRIPQQDEFAGQWVLINDEGEVRARGRVFAAGPLEAGETSLPLVWSGMLESGRYVLRWGSPAIGMGTTEFTVFDNGGGVGVMRQETTDQFRINQASETGG